MLQNFFHVVIRAIRLGGKKFRVFGLSFGVGMRLEAGGARHMSIAARQILKRIVFTMPGSLGLAISKPEYVKSANEPCPQTAA